MNITHNSLSIITLTRYVHAKGYRLAVLKILIRYHSLLLLDPHSMLTVGIIALSFILLKVVCSLPLKKTTLSIHTYSPVHV